MATNVAASSSPFARYLAYPLPSPDGPPTHFLKGPRDLLLVFGAFCVLVVMREIAMRAVFAPLGRRFIVEEGAPAKQRSTKGARRLTPKEVRRRQKKAIRLAEQGWSMLYYTVYWSFGLTVFLASPAYRKGHLIPFDFGPVWASYPTFALTGAEKFYYLTQLAFYIHQLVVVSVEARRKDHWQMFSHHVATISLIAGSYLVNMTHVGIVILVLLDVVDILLPAAKMLKYLGFRKGADAMFGTFVLTWIATRQFGLLLVIVGIYEDAARLTPVDTPELVDIGPYDFHFTRNMWRFFVVFLTFIWVLICIWFAMICNVIWKVLTGDGADDTRSEDEEESEEIEDNLSVEKSAATLASAVGPTRDEDGSARRRR